MTNFESTNYNSLHRSGVICTRQTFNVIRKFETQQEVGPLPEHREPQFRRYVKDHLRDSDQKLIYNNGDPLLFNPIASGVFESMKTLKQRKVLRDPNDPETDRQIAKLMIETVCDIQRKLVPSSREGSRRHAPIMIASNRKVGGRPHALALDSKGNFYPASGDL